MTDCTHISEPNLRADAQSPSACTDRGAPLEQENSRCKSTTLCPCNQNWLFVIVQREKLLRFAKRQKINWGEKTKPKPHSPHSMLDTVFCRTKTCGYKGNNLEKGNTEFWTLFQMQCHILPCVFPYCRIHASYSTIHKYRKCTIHKYWKFQFLHGTEIIIVAKEAIFFAKMFNIEYQLLCLKLMFVSQRQKPFMRHHHYSSVALLTPSPCWGFDMPNADCFYLPA